MKERIIIIEGPDERDIPLREPLPANEVRLLPPVFVPVGPGRGQWEEARAAVEYVPPARRAA